MVKVKKGKIEAKGFEIGVYTEDFKNDYISLTDIAKYKNVEEPNVVVSNWLRNYNTIEYLGIWESLNNTNFNPIEFEGVLAKSGTNAFTLSPTKWINITNAIGLIVKIGRYGGTYAHKDIAFKFASWISAEFELYMIKDYQKLKDDENSRLSLTWKLHREIAKINYKIHTDAIKTYLLADFTKEQLFYKYANEADMEIEKAEDKIISLIHSQYSNELSDMTRGSRQNRIHELFVKMADKDREYKKLQNDLRKVKEQMIDLFYKKIKNRKRRNIMVDYYIFREDVEV